MSHRLAASIAGIVALAMALATPSIAAEPSISDRLQALIKQAREEDNAEQRDALDEAVRKRAATFKGGSAEAYYAAGVVVFLKGYYNEALWAFAKAAAIKPTSALYLNNLAMVLIKLDRADEAVVYLQWVTAQYPNLDPPWGNLASAHLARKDCKAAEAAAARARALSPQSGQHDYSYGKALDCLGRKQEAMTYFRAAWDKGYAGSGREGGEGGGGKKSGSGSGSGSKGGGSESGDGDSSGSPSPRPGGARKPGGANRGAQPDSGKSARPDQFPAEWVGHYEARYVRAKSSDTAPMGQGMAMTVVRVDTLACAKEFSMDIDANGGIRGRGKVLYAWLGRAQNPGAMMMPGFAMATQGGMISTLKGGSQTRDWEFTGQAQPDGSVELTGLPTKELDFFNSGQWSKLPPWSPLPVDDRKHMRGPFHLRIVNEESGPALFVDKVFDLNDRVIKRLNYQAHLVKSDAPITPDCRLEDQSQAKCPATESLKTKVKLSSAEGFTIEQSRDVASGETATKVSQKLGPVTAGQDTGGTTSFEGSFGNLTGSAELNSDGSYVMTVGGCVEAKLSPEFKITNKLELIYDSRCGWGLKGTWEGEAGPVGGGVEGVVFLNAGA